MWRFLLGYWLHTRNKQQSREKEEQMEREMDFIRSKNRRMLEEREKIQESKH